MFFFIFCKCEGNFDLLLLVWEAIMGKVSGGVKGRITHEVD